MGSGLNWAAKVVPGKNFLKFQSKNNFLFISEHFAMFHTIRYKSTRLNLTQKIGIYYIIAEKFDLIDYVACSQDSYRGAFKPLYSECKSFNLNIVLSCIEVCELLY